MAFSDAIRTELSIESGGFCCNPECRAATGFFIKGQTKAAGDGAHIVAENLDGPRGASPLSPHERGLASNGIWLCPSCHRKVDIVQPELFKAETLQQWKLAAKVWWQQNQGKPIQVIARPDVRPQVARPSAASFHGAEMFLKAHQPLANGLSDLRWRANQHEVPIPDAVESQISQMSSELKIVRSWKDEWTTTYHCEDGELYGHMVALIQATDMLQRAPGTLFDGPRRVNLQLPDLLAQAIGKYLTTFDGLCKCLQRLGNL